MDYCVLTMVYQKWLVCLHTTVMQLTMQTMVLKLDHLTDLTLMVTLD